MVAKSQLAVAKKSQLAVAKSQLAVARAIAVTPDATVAVLQ